MNNDEINNNINAECIKALITAAMPGSLVQISSNDNIHFNAIIVSDLFAGITPVKRQQLVYKILGELIASGKLHAISMQTYSDAEWQNKKI